MRTKRVGPLENKVRRAVLARLQRGQRVALANAAGHQGPWLTNWLRGRQDATIDEIAAVLKKLHVPLGRLLDAPDATEIDWEVFGLMARVTKDERKRICRNLVEGMTDDALQAPTTAPAPTASASPRRQAVTDRRRKQA